MPLGRGRNVHPGRVVQHEGPTAARRLMACKGAGCPPGRPYAPNRNVFSRIGPLPGSDAEHADRRLERLGHLRRGRPVLVPEGFRRLGLECRRRSPSGDHAVVPGRLPAGGPRRVAAGRQLALAARAEIGYPFVPPNLFSSRTYAFMAGPAKHLGALLEMNLPLAPHGYASASFGLTSDWNSVDFGSGAGGPSFMFGARWRSRTCAPGSTSKPSTATARTISATSWSSAVWPIRAAAAASTWP